ncbi:MAG: Wzt carbohydrate-binding domain-containing protein, partial [Candidatus Saccharibacteria bacterium]|nr:Wzt carbohydrate-binding domain-containing protein [Candidatus Saccharibacteria bacterium]
VDFAELEKFMDQKLKNYSSGMQVRLAFAIAIQAHNDILLIDEVLAVGDANFQRKCFKVFREIKNSGKTVIFVTHAMEMVEEFCDRALMIQDSKVVAMGDPREIALRYQLANNTSGEETDGKTLKRPKNPAIKIKSIKILSNGKPADNFSLEDNITAQVDIQVSQPKNVQFNLFFVGSDGEYVAGINSLKDFAESKFTKGTHTIHCTVRAGQLVKDSYSVGVAIYSDEDVPEVVDIIDRAYEGKTPQININQSSKYKNGKFYITGNWSEGKA